MSACPSASSARRSDGHERPESSPREDLSAAVRATRRDGLPGRAAVRRAGRRSPYLTHQQETVTRGELRERVAKQAAVFAGYGIGPGSTVGLRTAAQLHPGRGAARAVAAGRPGDALRLPAQTGRGGRRSARPAGRSSWSGPAPTSRPTFGFRPEYEVVTECRGTGRPAADRAPAGPVQLRLHRAAEGDRQDRRVARRRDGPVRRDRPGCRARATGYCCSVRRRTASA